MALCQAYLKPSLSYAEIKWVPLRGMRHKSQEGQTQDHPFFFSSVFLALALKSPDPIPETLRRDHAGRPAR